MLYGKTEREEYYQRKILKIEAEKDEISARLEESKFNQIVFGSIFGVVAAGVTTLTASVPLLGSFALGNAVYQAFQGYNRRDLLTRDFAYLALIDKKLPNVKLNNENKE